MMAGIILLFISFTIKGVVLDINKTPLPYASVMLKGTRIGTVTDGNGNFSLTLPDTLKTGELKVSYIGYRDKVVKFSNKTRFIKIVLTPEVIKESPVVVKGSFSASQTEGITISKFKLGMMDIYTTPGAAADVFLTIKTIPAFSGDPDVATLTIRGGNPDEALVLVNGIRMKHPYIYSVSEQGGLFSIIPASAIGQVEAFAGVLPPSFGGKASGGVILKTLDVSNISSKSFTFVTGGLSLDLIDSKFGGIWTHLSSYKIMAELNGIDTKFSIYPFYGSIFYTNKFSVSNMTITPFGLYSYNKSEMDMSELGYGNLLTIDRNLFMGVKMVFLAPPFVYSASAGGNIKISNLDLEESFTIESIDRISGFRMQSSYFYDIDRIFTFGGEFYKNSIEISGNFVEDSSVGSFESEKKYEEENLFGQFQYSGEFLKIITGVWSGYRKVWVVDPRVLGEIRPGDVSVKFGMGKMSQINSGDSGWLRADHLSLEVERLFGSVSIRLGGFWKKYNNGSLCYGIEGMVKGKSFQFGAGWLHARDKNSVPLDYEIPVKITSYFTVPFSGWSAGVKFNYATGKPYTPIEGVEEDSSGLTPVYGDRNSKRMPDIIRIDLRISKMVNLPFLNGFFFLEIYNITNHKNVSGYVYSKDYREKQAIRYFDRMFVAGISVKI